jgi:hypothetical protein
MANINDTVQSYIAMWNEPDAQARRSLVAQTVTDDATYLDPMLSGSGVDGIADMIGSPPSFRPRRRPPPTPSRPDPPRCARSARGPGCG